MGRFLKDREYLTGRSQISQKLADLDYPIDLPADVYKGAWVITESGEMQWASGDEWVPLAPPGTEMMIPPWVDVPLGWFEISGRLGGDFENRRVIANKFDFAYVDNDLLSWMLPVAANMWETSDQNVQVASPPSPVGFLIDSTLPRVNWVQSVSGNRPVWGQVTRFAAGENRTIDQITFNRLGQAFVLDIPARTIGTMIVCTSQGIYALGVDIPQGNYTYGRWDHLPVEEILLLSKFLTNSEIEAFKDFLVETRFRVRDNFGAVTNLESAFRDRTDIISFPVIDTSNVTTIGSVSVNGAWRGCSNMQTFPILNMDSCLSAYSAWENSGLTSFPLISFPVCGTFRASWTNCSDLLSFPALNLAAGWVGNNQAIQASWRGCTSLQSFPTGIILPAVSSWNEAWHTCSALDNRAFIAGAGWSFPFFNSAAVETLSTTWFNCASLKNFPPLNTSNVSNFNATWDGCAQINNIVNHGVIGGDPYSFPEIDTSSGEGFFRTWRYCSAMTSFPPLDFSSAIGTIGVGINHGFDGTWAHCALLATFPVNMFNLSQTNNYTNAFLNCALTETSVDNILVSINTARAAFSLVNGRIDITGGTNASPSVATGRPAVDALRAAGWTVNVVGYPA